MSISILLFHTSVKEALLVSEKPVIESQNSEVIAQTGGTATLQCRATGNPKPNISWRDFNGKINYFYPRKHKNCSLFYNKLKLFQIFSFKLDFGLTCWWSQVDFVDFIAVRVKKEKGFCYLKKE